ncbi:MAG: 4-alpha-glucanotransferase [Pseudomonadota bacterium]
MLPRGAGILMHLTCLPGSPGVGDLGPAAWRAAEWLAEAGMSLWQILPLVPTEPGRGNSPYNSSSTFAGNPLFISPELLLADGLLTPADLDSAPELPPERVDYETVWRWRGEVLRRACRRAFSQISLRQEIERFAAEQASWLDDYCLFACLAREHAGRLWSQWPWELRDRQPEALIGARQRLAGELDLERFQQWAFSRQWQGLKAHCRGLGLTVLGDLPIYVDQHSADVWAHPELFKLDGAKNPWVVAGVPPDYFSANGQRWGNPVYDWEAHQRSGFAWWRRRLDRHLELYDMVRVDHFRGLVAYWEIPAREATAIHGKWVEAPIYELFKALARNHPALPIVAEDLGVITADVREARRILGLPGMVLLIFAFGEDNPANPYQPHNHRPDLVAYTGTHDNNTLLGWLKEEADPATRLRILRYIGRATATDAELVWEMIRMAMASVASLAVVPVQDALCLGGEARMNLPSRSEGNWNWRLKPGQLDAATAARLRGMAATYGRG